MESFLGEEGDHGQIIIIMFARIVTALTGIWLMASPDIFSLDKTASDNDQIVGPVIATFSIVALWECTRNVRWFNFPLALWLLMTPWILSYENIVAIVNDLCAGLLVMLLTFVPPNRTTHFAGGWPAVWK